MRKNVLLQFILLLVPIGLLWFGLKQLNWIEILKIEKISKKTEEKLGEIFWDIFKNSEQEIQNPDIHKPVEQLFNRICLYNKLEPSKYKIYILNNSMVNAFALPNKQLVIYTGLILACDSSAELCGVMAHELAHIQKRHVTKKLISEMGLGAVISISGGKAGGEVLRQAAQMVSSAAFSRAMEKEADLTGADYLYNANISVTPLANFMFKLASDKDMPTAPAWISSHPASDDRAKYLLEYAETHPVLKSEIMPASEWEKLQNAVKQIIQIKE
ncbi:MAG: M48 family metallopeptidase [Bacteroidetes bacterium]|nr:M48 family metallopeptidase [Bacteroidota bacterium]